MECIYIRGKKFGNGHINREMISLQERCKDDYLYVFESSLLYEIELDTESIDTTLEAYRWELYNSEDEELCKKECDSYLDCIRIYDTKNNIDFELGMEDIVDHRKMEDDICTAKYISIPEVMKLAE